MHIIVQNIFISSILLRLYEYFLACFQGFSENLHCVLCLAENAVGPMATRPDDIHTFYSGKYVTTVEKPYFAFLYM